ncbi:hypothetical protein CEXT_810281 [Caerostris extrusa]|uniref:Uncharacterized protein n=1 Tax=Caerostris extrusa TaxID=172846 RepID=A0AAV4UD41_CAEEX|nr:hypothetical protein CEXT_810281 [Caerostris extrusa]
MHYKEERRELRGRNSSSLRWLCVCALFSFNSEGKFKWGKDTFTKERDVHPGVEAFPRRNYDNQPIYGKLPFQLRAFKLWLTHLSQLAYNTSTVNLTANSNSRVMLEEEKKPLCLVEIFKHYLSMDLGTHISEG